MMQQDPAQVRLGEVQERLALVLDPELDQPLTELGFVGSISIAGEHVTVGFRLPTYWCSPNFAYLMASDIRDRVSELPWVASVHVDLLDHFASAEISGGVNGRRSFTETFPGLANEELQELRAKFRVKAFIARQERVLRHLMSCGFSDELIVSLTVGALPALLENEQDQTGLGLVRRYLEIRAELGMPAEPDDPAFTEAGGRILDPERFRAYLRTARTVRLNMEFNSSLCQGLLQTRYALVPESELTLSEESA